MPLKFDETSLRFRLDRPSLRFRLDEPSLPVGLDELSLPLGFDDRAFLYFEACSTCREDGSSCQEDRASLWDTWLRMLQTQLHTRHVNLLGFDTYLEVFEYERASKSIASSCPVSPPKSSNGLASQSERFSDVTLQAVMSFHACGGNVGDNVNISLPRWVLEAGRAHPEIFYTDKAGCRNQECLSLFADESPVLAGRTPLQCYSDYMAAFRAAMGEDFGTVLTEVAVGMGPCGELRYPAYPGMQHLCALSCFLDVFCCVQLSHKGTLVLLQWREQTFCVYTIGWNAPVRRLLLTPPAEGNVHWNVLSSCRTYPKSRNTTGRRVLLSKARCFPRRGCTVAFLNPWENARLQKLRPSFRLCCLFFFILVRSPASQNQTGQWNALFLLFAQ